MLWVSVVNRLLVRAITALALGHNIAHKAQPVSGNIMRLLQSFLNQRNKATSKNILHKNKQSIISILWAILISLASHRKNQTSSQILRLIFKRKFHRNQYSLISWQTMTQLRHREVIV